MEKKTDYKKAIAQVIYFDDEDIVARTVTCERAQNEVYHDYCTANDCLLFDWMGDK